MELYPYQREAVEAVGRSNNLRLIVSMTGSGKSIIARHIAGDRKCLVLTQASVVPQMMEYFPSDPIWSFNKFCMDKYLHNEIKSYVNEHKPVLIIDEAGILKSHGNKISKILMKIKSYFEDIYMFTACPAPNGLWEYFTSSFLAGGILGDNYYKFLMKWTVLARGMECIPNHGCNRKLYLAKGFKMVVKDEDGLIKEISKFCYVIDRNQILKDMPKQVFSQRFYDLTKEQISIYSKVLSDSILILKDRSIPLQNKLVCLTKLQQIESGFFYDDNKNIHELKNNKLKTLFELLDSIGKERVIIFTQFIYEKNLIMNAFQDICTEDWQDFKEGKYQYLVGHPKSIGVGISLECARYCVFYSNSFSFEDRLQSEGRIYRISQSSGSVWYYDVMPSSSTISHTIIKVLKHKGNLDELAKEVCTQRVRNPKADHNLSQAT